MQRSRSIATSGESSSGLRKWRLGSMKRERPPPQPKVMSCSGHSPPLSHTGQSSGCPRSEEHTSELQSRPHLVCRLLLEKKKPRLTPSRLDNYQHPET